MNEDVVCHDEQGVARLTLNRPSSGNSLSLSTIQALHSHLDRLAQRKDIGAIVLSGVGQRIFCAGHDLKEIRERDDAEFFSALSVQCSAMMQALQSQPQIVVAAIDGVATAAGCQLVAAADLAIATTRSRFATPGVNIGLWCVTPMVALSRAVAPKHAMQMLATGELMDAEFAVRIGLVNEAVAPDAFEARVSQLAGQIAAKSTFTLATGKRAFYRQLQMSTAEAYEYVGEVGVRNSIHPDAIEGIQAFIDKRPPAWRGRA
jgi:enoyl-CoA hydratase/carnithine racemase